MSPLLNLVIRQDAGWKDTICIQYRQTPRRRIGRWDNGLPFLTWVTIGKLNSFCNFEPYNLYKKEVDESPFLNSRIYEICASCHGIILFLLVMETVVLPSKVHCHWWEGFQCTMTWRRSDQALLPCNKSFLCWSYQLRACYKTAE